MPLRPRPHTYIWIAAAVIAYSVLLLVRSMVSLASLRAMAGVPPDHATLPTAVVVAVAALPVVYALFTDSDWAAPVFAVWGATTLAWQVIYIKVAVLPVYNALFAMMNNRPSAADTQWPWASLLPPAIVLALTYWYLIHRRATPKAPLPSGLDDSAA